MKKFLKFAGLFVISVSCLAACGTDDGKEDDGTNHLTLARWDIEQVNTARKKKTPLYKAIKDATGVDAEVMSVSSSSYSSKINLLYASEELPDVFVSTAWDTPSAFRNWIRDDAVVDYTKYVNATDYPNLYARIEKFSWLKSSISYFNGGMYALPIIQLPLHCLYVRTDWIENLNAKLGDILVSEGVISTKSQYTNNPSAYAQYKFKLPDTLTDFYRLTYAFTKYDPDGDGKNNTNGYTCCTSNMWYNNWIFEAMSSADKHDCAYWGYVEGDDNKLVSSWTTEGNKKAIYFLNKLYKEGILDPDFMRLSESEARTNFIQGTTGIYMENFYYNDILRSFMATYNKTMEEAKKMFTCTVPAAGQSGVRGMRVDPGFWDGVCISNRLSERKIKLALKFLDYLAGPEAKELFTYGIEGIHYTVQDGVKVSKMGKKDGLNRTLETYDDAFPLSSFTNWDYKFKSPYMDNREFIFNTFNSLIDVGKHDPVCVLQPETYVEYDLPISTNSKEEFVGFIKNNSLYNSTAKKGFQITDNDWDDLTGCSSLYTTTFNTTWSNFVTKFNTNWHGTELINAMNQLYPSVKQMYEDFFPTCFERFVL